MTEVSTLPTPSAGVQQTDILPLVRPAIGSTLATAYALTLQSFPLVTLAATTGNTTPTTLVAAFNSLTLPNSVCAARYSGHCKAMNPTTGHYVTWDLAVSLKRSAVGQVPTLDFTTVVELYADSDLAGCSLVTNVNVNGLLLVAIGLAGTTLDWTASLLVS
jgi:hypothetical protein